MSASPSTRQNNALKMTRRELLAHIIAYNLLRALMNHGRSPGTESASFKGTIDRLNHWLPIVCPATIRNSVSDN